MGSRRDLVRMFVLDAICDDYENLAVSIETPVRELGGRCGLDVEKAEIVQALMELLELGWAKAYRLYASRTPDEYAETPSIEDMEDPMGAWFYITETGRAAHLADSHAWPFDESGVLKKGWSTLEI